MFMRNVLLAIAVSGSAAVGMLTLAQAQAQDFPPKPLPEATPKAAERAETGKKAAEEKTVSIVMPWSRATPGGSKTGAVFLEIKAAAAVTDKLISAASAVAETVEIHNHINDAGVMRMRRVDAVELEAGGSTKLVPGGYHIMLLGLKQPLKAGETFKLKLTFEKAAAIEVDVTVRPNSAAAGKGSGSGSH
jgi:periplasmic copper chaperone A